MNNDKTMMHLGVNPPKIDEVTSETQVPSYPEFSFAHPDVDEMPKGGFDFHGKAEVMDIVRARRPGGNHKVTMRVTHIGFPKPIKQKDTSIKADVGKMFDRAEAKRAEKQVQSSKSTPSDNY